MASEGEMEKSKEMKGRTQPKGEFLAFFWTLSEEQDGRRLSATKEMVEYLSDKQRNGEVLCKDLDYALKRLLKGLASDRKWSRLGFSTALTQVLRKFPIVTAAIMLDMLEKANDELSAGGYEDKSDKKNADVGRVMAYLALMQSGAIHEADGKDVERVVKGLVKIRRKRKDLQQLATEALCQLIVKTAEGMFRDHVWHYLEEELSTGWKDCTPDTLQVLLVVNDHHKSCVSKNFLSEHWNTKNILNTKNHTFLKAIMSESVGSLPVVHRVCPMLVRKAMKKEEVFTHFWSEIINDGFASQSLKHRSLAFRLVSLSLPLATTAKQVTTILSDNVVKAIVNSRTAHFNHKPLHNAAGFLIADIVKFAGNCPDGDVQLAVILSLLNSKESCMFDPRTRTKAISEIEEKLKPDAMEKWTELLMEMILGREELPTKEDNDIDIDTRKSWAVFELSRLLSKANDREWQLKILKFLFLHGFFKLETPAGFVHGSKLLDKALSPQTCTDLHTAFFKSLDRLDAQPHKADGSSRRDKRPYISMVHEVVQYAQTLMSTEGLEMRQEFSVEVKQHWEKMFETVEKIAEKHEKDAKIGEGHAFELLFLCLGLQLFSEPQAAMDILEDLYICYNKAFKQKRRVSMKQSTAGPDWMEVVTDASLSLLSQGSHLVRKVVVSVFAMLAPHTTKASLNLILNVFKPKTEEEEDLLEFEDDDEEDAAEEDKEGQAEKQEEEESSEEDEEEDEDEEEAEEVDESLRLSLKQALGKAAIGSDEEDDEESSGSDFDDETMFKLDNAISAAFKSMTKNKKNSKYVREQKQQLKAYRMKCLDLIKAIVDSEPSPSLALELVMPLLDLMDHGVRDKTYRDEGNRATKIFRALVANRKVLPDPTLDRDALPEEFQELVKRSTTVAGPQMVKDVALACLFLIRLQLGLDMASGPSPLRTRAGSVLRAKVKKDKVLGNQQKVLDIIKASLADYCNKRESHFNHIFFYTLLSRQSSMLWALTDQLLDLATNIDVRVFCRTQVWAMLAAMITRSTAADVDSESWSSFMDRLVAEIQMAFESIDMDDLKPKIVQELLAVSVRVWTTCPHLQQKMFSDNVIAQIRKVKERQLTKTDLKRACRKVLVLVGKVSEKNRQANPAGDSVAKKRKQDAGPTELNGHGKTPTSRKKKKSEIKDEDKEASVHGMSPSKVKPKNLDDSLDELSTPKRNLYAEIKGASWNKTNRKRSTSETAANGTFVESSQEMDQGEAQLPTTPSSKKKKNKKKKKENESLREVSTPKASLCAEIEAVCTEGEKRSSPLSTGNGVEKDHTEEKLPTTPPSRKKNKKKKNQTECLREVSTPKASRCAEIEAVCTEGEKRSSPLSTGNGVEKDHTEEKLPTTPPSRKKNKKKKNQTECLREVSTPKASRCAEIEAVCAEGEKQLSPLSTGNGVEKDSEEDHTEETTPHSKKKNKKNQNNSLRELSTPKIEAVSTDKKGDSSSKVEPSANESWTLLKTPTSKKKESGVEEVSGKDVTEVRSVRKSARKSRQSTVGTGTPVLRSAVTVSDPDGVGEGLEGTFTPVKMNDRRRSVRISMRLDVSSPARLTPKRRKSVAKSEL